MDGFGPITDSRTLEDAVREIVLRLQKHEKTDRTKKLLADAKRYQLLLAAWRDDPPDREEQFEIVGHVLQLLGTVMQFLEMTPRVGPKAPELDLGSSGVCVSTDGAQDPLIEVGETRQPFPLADDHQPGDSQPPQHYSAPPASDVLYDDDPSVRMPFEMDLGDNAGVPRSTHYLTPHLEPWLALPRQVGVRLKVVFHREGGSSRHVLVRLDGGADLASHEHSTDELVQVIDGCILCNDEQVRAGDFICNPAGTTSPSLRSVGESTLLLIDSDRRFE